VVFQHFSRLFTSSTWRHVQVLLIGAILCQGARRVSTILRVMGLLQVRRFEKYHRDLNRAKWNSVTGSKILMGLLLQRLPSNYPLLIVPLPWCQRPWALPFMTILAPSKKSNEARGRKHKTSIDWTMIAVRVISRWLKRSFILIGDGGFACIRLVHACKKKKVVLVSRLRRDAALYDLPLSPIKGQLGRHREKGVRVTPLKMLAADLSQDWQETEVTWYGNEKKSVRMMSGINLWYSAGEKPLFIRWVLVIQPAADQADAFFSTDLNAAPDHIINHFVLRWNVEVTFEESRAHLGIETQRQWSDKAIARTTPCLMALFSLVCLFTIEMMKNQALPILSTAWYNKKSDATFSDIMAYVRRSIWAKKYFNDSRFEGEVVLIKHEKWETLLDQLSRAA